MIINGVEIPLDKNWQRIGISLSGGADSALLAYLICSNTEADIHITTQVRCWKTRPWQRYVAIDVYDWLRNRFDNRFFKYENFIPPEFEWADKGPTIVDEYGKLKSGNQIELRAFNEYICHIHKIDAWFAGVNKNPPVDFPGALEDRNEGHIPPIIEHMGVTVCHPFIHTTKDWIIDQYYRLDIIDLLNLTRSCEGEFDNLNYKNYVPYQTVPTCGKCFWCLEREWGINNANSNLR
jgi:hypothetical protein